MAIHILYLINHATCYFIITMEIMAYLHFAKYQLGERPHGMVVFYINRKITRNKKDDLFYFNGISTILLILKIILLLFIIF